jgi:outer membrane protein
MTVSLRTAARAALLSACLLLGAGARTPAGAADARIAVIDVQRAVMATEDGIRAQATLKKTFDRRQADLDAKQNDLAKAKLDIEKQARVVSREAVQKRMEDWQRRMVELQTVFVEYNKELQQKQAELTAPIVKKMMAVIARVAKKSGFEVIIDRQAAPYVRADLDLTEQVIQLYNAGGDTGDSGGEEKKPDGK